MRWFLTLVFLLPFRLKGLFVCLLFVCCFCFGGFKTFSFKGGGGGGRLTHMLQAGNIQQAELLSTGQTTQLTAAGLA